MLTRNPCDYAELPRMERKEMQALSAEEVSRFLAKSTEDEYGIVFAFAVTTGMRPEEYLSLKWSDFDLEARTATVTRTLGMAERWRLVFWRTENYAKPTNDYFPRINCGKH